MSGVRAFFSDLVSDLKSSWRFKLAIILWIPLVVTTIVALVQFAAMDQAGNANTFATTQLIAESTVNFPMFYVYRGWDGLAYFQSVVCIAPNGQRIPTGSCGTKYGYGSDVNPLANCTLVNAQNFAATPTNQKIQCVISLSNVGVYTNPVYQLTVVGADGIPDDMVWINPTQYVSVAVQQVLTMQSESASIDTSWSADIDYYTTAALTSSVFQMEVRIDDFNNNLYTNSNTFTDYQFLAAWGGVMAFFYVLFAFTFFIAKLFIGDDSKVLH